MAVPGPTPTAARRGALTRRQRQNVAVVIGWLGVCVVVGGAWELTANNEWADPIFIGQPTRILDSFVVLMREGLITDAGYTTLGTLIGFALASVAGTATAFLLAQSKVSERVVKPFFTALNSLPRIALAPLFLIWFGIGLSSKVALAASLTFFVVYYNTTAGIDSLSPDHSLLARVLGASRLQMFLKFVVPSAIPSIFVGMELGFIYGMLGTIASEMIAGEHGLGVRLTGQAAIFDTNGYFATLFLLTIITTLISLVFRWIRNRLLRWQALDMKQGTVKG